MYFAPLSKLIRRLRYWLHRERLERELQEEVAEHRRQRGAASVPQSSAVAEDARAVWIPPTLGSFVQDLRYGIRQLGHQRLFTFVCLSGLAISIGLNTAVFSIVEAIVWRPFPITAGERVVRFFRLERDDRTASGFSEDELRHYRESGALEAFTGYATDNPTAEWPAGAVLNGTAAFVAPNFFDMLGGRAILGRLLTAEEQDQPVLVITETAWRRRLQARPGVLGEKLLLNGVPFTVVGVLADGPAAIIGNASCDLVLPLRAAKLVQREAKPLSLKLLARLSPGMNLEQAHSVLGLAAQRWFDSYPEDSRAYRPVAIYARLAGGDMLSKGGGANGPELLFPLASLLVLVIACANLMNLLLARAEARRRELAVRLSLGAGRARLIRQLLTECFLLTTCAGLLGLAAANGALRWALYVLPQYLPAEAIVPWLDLGVNRTVFLFVLGLCALTAFLFGAVPAWEATRTATAGAMKGEAPRPGQLGARLRDVLVAAQMAACVTLLVLNASLRDAMSVLEDYLSSLDTQSVVQAHVSLNGYTPSAARDYFQRARQRLAAIPEVEAVAITSYPMLRAFGRGRNEQLEVEGETRLRPAPAMDGFVSDGTPAVFGLRLARGRDFTPQEGQSGASVVLINEPMAVDVFGAANPIGRRIRVRATLVAEAGPWLEIVGVVAEKRLGESGAGSHCLLRPLAGDTGGVLQIRTRPDRRAAVIAAARAGLRELDARNVPSLNSLEVFVNFVRWMPRLSSAGAIIVALVSLWMAAVGLYGVTAYAAARRTKEIGIRMALGARTAQVLHMIVRQGAVLVGAGVVIGSVMAWGAERIMISTLRILPARPLTTCLAVAAFLATVALAAMLMPSWRASRVNPVAALREDG